MKVRMGVRMYVRKFVRQFVRGDGGLFTAGNRACHGATDVFRAMGDRNFWTRVKNRKRQKILSLRRRNNFQKVVCESLS